MDICVFRLSIKSVIHNLGHSQLVLIPMNTLSITGYAGINGIKDCDGLVKFHRARYQADDYLKSKEL